MINKDYKQLICSFLNDRSFRFKVMESESRCRFHLGFKGLKGAFDTLKMLIALDEYAVQIFVYIPITAEKCLPQMVDFVARLNYNLILGKFEVCHIDGRVRYQFGQNVNILSAKNARDALAAMIFQSLLFVVDVSEGFVDIINGGKSDETFNKLVDKGL